ncbi:right-handed parallel beta-helix repeat-containing protein [Corynebacterium sp. H78]|uniref:right-handed parallel beta-helix repeat-containing protein n=1 Tax=Corynebacterium sp. H78 TaxID=3133417 RepID=UPI0030B78417
MSSATIELDDVTSSHLPQPAVIIAPDGSRGIDIANSSHIAVVNLTIIGSRQSDAVSVWSDLTGTAGIELRYLRVSSAHVGIAVGGACEKALTGVSITNCHVQDCLRDGILIYGDGTLTYVNHDVLIADTSVVSTSGIPEWTNRNSGSGIVAGQCQNLIIERCTASGNGFLCSASEGPCGMWTYYSDAVSIRHCVSIGNRTSGPADGTGFDLDIGVTNAEIADCIAYGNDGAGVMLWNASPTEKHCSHRIQGNRLINNCNRTHWHGEITVSPYINDVDISNNWISNQSGRSPIRIARNTNTITTRHNSGLHPIEPDYYSEVPR